MQGGKTITIELDEVEAAAFAMLQRDCINADPGACWDDRKLAKSMLMSVIEDDLAAHRPERVN